MIETDVFIQAHLFIVLAASLFALLNAAVAPPPQHRVRRQGTDAHDYDDDNDDDDDLDDVPNGCAPATGIGGFLLFPLLKAWCEEQGATEFGVYGRKK